MRGGSSRSRHNLRLRIPTGALCTDFGKNAAERRILGDAARVALINGGSQRIEFFPGSPDMQPSLRPRARPQYGLQPGLPAEAVRRFRQG